MEPILGYSEHTVTGEKSWSALGNVIDTKVLPLPLTLQYHFLPDARIWPYAIAGVNYTYFFNEKVPSGSLISAAGDEVKLESSWGWAAQAGVEIAINQDWSINMDMKYLNIDTTALFKNIAVGSAKIDADIDPYVLWHRFGHRF